MKDCKIVFLGSEGVGKSALIHQYIDGSFDPDHRPTVEESYRRMVQLPDGNYANIEILDTAGNSDFPAMRRLRIQHANAFVVVYAVNDEQSFRSAVCFYEQILTIKGSDDVPIVLVGNKLDCDETRKISTEDATKLASSEMGCSFVECSAKCNLNVGCVFDVLLLKRKQQEDVNVNEMLSKTTRRYSSRSLCSQNSTKKKPLQRNFSVCSCVMATSDKKKKHVHSCKIM